MWQIHSVRQRGKDNDSAARQHHAMIIKCTGRVAMAGAAMRGIEATRVGHKQPRAARAGRAMAKIPRDGARLE